MTADLPGPAGWSGPYDPEQYLQAVSEIEAFDQWADAVGMRDPAIRALWLAIARADLAGEPLTTADLYQRTGVSRYVVSRMVRRWVAQKLLIAERNPLNQRHTIVCLTRDGRGYLMKALEAVIERNISV